MIGESWDQTLFGHRRFGEADRSTLVHLVQRSDGGYQVLTAGESLPESAIATRVPLHPRAALSLTLFAEEMAASGEFTPQLSFGFRDLATQFRLFRSRLKKSGSFRKTISTVAPPGYSEHHTGLVVDFANYHAVMDRVFPVFGWERSFARESGSGLAAEAWHWRFVGRPAIERALILGTPDDRVRRLAHRMLRVCADDDFDAVFDRTPPAIESAPDRVFLIADHLMELGAPALSGLTPDRYRPRLVSAGQAFLRDQGITDADTAEEVRVALACLIPLGPGDRSDRVRRLTAALARLGLWSGPSVDVFDEAVARAIRRVERAWGWPETGICGLSLVRAIRARAVSLFDMLDAEHLRAMTNGVWTTQPPPTLAIQRVTSGRETWTLAPGMLTVASSLANGWDVTQTSLARVTEPVANAAVLVDGDRPVPPAPVPILTVPNARTAMEHLAQVARRHFQGQVIAITGSSGKTTTKGTLRHVLSRQGIVFATPGSANDRFAVAMALANASFGGDFFVAECGLGVAGSPLARLSRLLVPSIAVVTNVFPAHAGGYASVEEIARRKMEVAAHLDARGTLVLDGDSPYLDLMLAVARKQGNRRVVTFGTTPPCDVRVLDWQTGLEGSRGVISVLGARQAVAVPHVGDHWGKLIACVLGCVRLLGLDLAQAAQDVAGAAIPPGRGRLLGRVGETLLIYDSHYNANPGSMRAELAAFQALPLDGLRRVGVIGGMAELGEGSAGYHMALLPDIEAVGFDHVLFVGEATDDLARALAARGHSVAHHPDADAVLATLTADLGATDALFLKGSHSNNLLLVLRGLLDRTKPRRPSSSASAIAE